ncbi:ribonuclease R [Mycoplasmopsis bovirhinis]|uniref:Ribonuclease R n=1 Tax=Mycoplasmopsis bovirhinis TaxID=29553 RepID=A0A449ACK3_9BACT|nr:ribonuclease R [Mycoplasmopsis bovirhinis]VEU62737.1 VACB-like ribonuclease II [Mycoplasmopsis bovirhinis]
MNQEKIIRYISQAKARTFLEIAKYFRISPSNNKELTSLLSVLQKNHKIFKNHKDEYYAVNLIKTIEGNLSVNQKGMFGFVDYDIDLEANTKKSVFIKSFNFNGAMHNDTVKVNVYQNIYDTQATVDGVIEQIIARNTQEIHGFIKLKNDITYFTPVDARYSGFTWKIDNSVATKLNDLVLAKINKIEVRNINIDILKVITNEADPMVYVKYYLEEVKIPSSFPKILDTEISLIPQTIDKEDQSNRKDLTNKMIVTIDGDDTKDFDDAIYVKKLQNGNYLLGVYIADVSYYVTQNSEIDKEALKRGTSIYLVDQVIPMLPVELSNGICSLNPNQKRFVMACEMEIDQNGKNVNFEIFQGIIESKFRLTYKQVDKYFKENNIGLDDKDPKVSELKAILNQAQELSKIIHNFKINQGYVDFQISEPKIKLDEFGSVKEIIINERGESEVLIEDFMVRANETIATFLSENKLPALYRVHDAPDELKITSLKNSLAAVGIDNISLNANSISPAKFAKFVNYIKTLRDDDFIKLMFLRTMQKAVYSNQNVGHFGLASDNYCHFTSPIRRYPDLVIHRVIRELVFNKKKYLLEQFEDNLAIYSDLNTKAEHKAVQTERFVNDLKFAEYLKNQTGKVFKVQILSIMNFGFFVEFDFKASGLVHKSNLFDGEYEPNDNLTKLIGQKRTFTLGDYVNVVIINTDLVAGKVDCILEDQYSEYLKLKQKRAFDSKNQKHNVKAKLK